MKTYIKRQAWIKIRNAYKRKKLPKIASLGLCYAIGRLLARGHIRPITYTNMLRDLLYFRPCSSYSLYYWPLKEKGPDLDRVNAINQILKGSK